MIIDRRVYADMVPPDWRRLTAEEERDIHSLIAAGDEECRDTMVLYNIPLVLSVASEYSMPDIMQEIIGAGMLGLIESTYDYNPDRGRFSTHAMWAIRKRASETVCSMLHAVSVPAHANVVFSRLAKAARRCGREGIEYNADNVSGMIGLSPRATEGYMRLKMDGGVSLDDGGESAVHENDVGRKYGRHVDMPVTEMLDMLDETDRLIVTMRYGLDGHDTMRYNQIGRIIGLTHQRVHQRCKAALATLKAVLRSPKKWK